jgi:predicted PurR-regulated permease PerM
MEGLPVKACEEAALKPEQPISITTRTLIVAIVLGLAVWLAPLVATFISLMTLAVILGASLVPPIKWISKRFGLKRELAVTSVFVALMLGAGLSAFLIIPTVIDQIRTLTANLPHYVDNLQGTLVWAQDIASKQALRYGTKLPAIPTPDLRAVGTEISANASVWVGSSLGVAGKFVGFLGMGILTLMLSFFVLLEGPSLRRSVLALVPPPKRALLDAQIDPITAKLGGYVQGMALSIAVLAVYQVAVLSGLGLPLALALGLLSALLALVPLVGGFIGIIPPALVGLSVSWQTALWALVLGYLGHFLVANFMMPIVFARSVKLSPLMVTVALLLGAEAMGMFGALVAVPVAAVVQVLVQNLYIEAMERRHAQSERDALKFSEAPLPRLRGLADSSEVVEVMVARHEAISP